MKSFLIIILAFSVFISGTSVVYASDMSLPFVNEGKEHLSSLNKIFVKKFLFKGNLVFSDKELSSLIERFLNRVITAEELQEVKDKITKHYIDNGYINSGVVIPDQDVKGGSIKLEIIEGKINKIYVLGLKYLNPGYIIKRINIVTKDGKLPLNINKLQERLKLLKQDPLIKNVNAELHPGLKRGEADLYVQVVENRPYNMEFKFNNHNSPGVGSNTGKLEIKILDISTWGDSVEAGASKSRGALNYNIEYALPVNRWGTTVNVSADETKSDVVSKPFNELDIFGLSRNYSFGIRHPFYKTVSSEFVSGVKFEKRYSKTYLLDLPFSFSSGVENGESRVSALRFFQEWVDRSLTQVFAFRSTVTVGLKNLDAIDRADESEGGPDAQFVSWVGQTQYIRSLNALDSQLFFSLSMQLSNDKLLPMEKFAIGGSSTVRGYRENFLTADNGAVTSLEWLVPVTKWVVPDARKNSDKFDIKLAAFFDYGAAWNTKTAQRPAPDSIYSVGIGLRSLFYKKVEAQIDWGYGLRDIQDQTDKDLQDCGIHFQIKSAFF